MTYSKSIAAKSLRKIAQAEAAARATAPQVPAPKIGDRKVIDGVEHRLAVHMRIPGQWWQAPHPSRPTTFEHYWEPVPSKAWQAVEHGFGGTKPGYDSTDLWGSPIMNAVGKVLLFGLLLGGPIWLVIFMAMQAVAS